MSTIDNPISASQLRYFRSLAVSEVPSRPFGEIKPEETQSLNSYYVTAADDSVHTSEIMKIHRRRLASYSFKLPQPRQPKSIVFATIGPDITEDSLRVVEYRDTLDRLQYLTGTVDESGETAKFGLYRREAMFIEKYDYASNGEWTFRTLISADGRKQVTKNPSAEMQTMEQTLQSGEIPLEINYDYSIGSDGILKMGRSHIRAHTSPSFEVSLLSAGSNKLAVVKVVRNLLGLSLFESKRLVESAPQTIASDVTTETALKIQDELKSAGASVQIVLKSSPTSLQLSVDEIPDDLIVETQLDEIRADSQMD